MAATCRSVRRWHAPRSSTSATPTSIPPTIHTCCLAKATLFSTYRIGDKWRVGGGFTAVSQNKPANSVTSLNRAPGYVKADALLEYRVNEGNSIKLNIDNLFDKVYFNTLYRGFAAPGDARSVRVTLTSKF